MVLIESGLSGVGSLGISPRASGYAFCRKGWYLWLSKHPSQQTTVNIYLYIISHEQWKVTISQERQKVQSLANLALANNSNYTNRKGASKPPPNHSVTVCCLGIVFQPSRQSSQPETQSYRITKRHASDLVPAA